MRILMVSDFYAPYVGGVEMMVRSLSHELVARGHSVAVATLGRDDLPATQADDGVRVHRIRGLAQRFDGLFTSADRPWAPPMPDPMLVRGLRRVVEQERPDVVHGHDWLARSHLAPRGARPPLAMSLHHYTLSCSNKTLVRDGAPCAGPRAGRCVHCAARHYGRLKGPPIAAAQMAFSRREAAMVDLFLPVSRATAEGNGLEAAAHRYEVIHNFVGRAPDPGPHADLLAQLPSEPFLLFVGVVSRYKGTDVLLDAYAKLAGAPPLVLLGKLGPEGRPSLPPGAVLHEGWPNAAVRAAMPRALALVVPSVWQEPFGLVAVEALAAGTPVVASSAGGLPEIVGHEQEGLLVAPGDRDALADALVRMTADPTLRDRLAAAAVTRATAFTPETIVPRFEAAYARLASRSA